MDKEVNEILFMDDKESEMKDSIIEEVKKKQKKPRPRDIYNFIGEAQKIESTIRQKAMERFLIEHHMYVKQQQQRT